MQPVQSQFCASLQLGTGQATKTGQFSEKFHFRKIMLQIFFSRKTSGKPWEIFRKFIRSFYSIKASLIKSLPIWVSYSQISPAWNGHHPLLKSSTGLISPAWKGDFLGVICTFRLMRIRNNFEEATNNQILGAVFLFLGFTATTFVRQLMTNFKLSKWPSVWYF